MRIRTANIKFTRVYLVELSALNVLVGFVTKDV